MNSLLAGAALAIDCSTWHGFREACGENGVASDVGGLLAHLHDAACNYVVDKRGIKLVARDQAVERETQEIDRVPGFQRAVAPAKRRADCINDHGFSIHFCRFRSKPLTQFWES